ncbi:hypothetical protein JTE90_017877 [Oedothorax gibbosus]|uniref:ZSWIM3 N-terminal domain-containing protein n=1 Tax=Oedothorax gibbosus TaxID=931172 RepID=A0AAV6V3S3_9ARAC|nr:hypothetical protein JTE90_017877 [Oedothorax gibbosus]
MPQLKYCRVKFVCVRGGKFCHKGTGKRNSRTTKTGCQATIYLSHTRDGKNLQIRKLNEVHNHEVSEELFNKLPKQQRLPPDLREKAKEMLDMKVNKKLLLQKLRSETGKMLTMKSVHNLAQIRRLCPKPEEIMLQQGHDIVPETYTTQTDVSINHSDDYEAEETITNEPVLEDTEIGDKMVFVQNKANKAVEDLIREKKRSNDLKERLLHESRKQNKYLEALVKSNTIKEQLIEESKKRNQYLEAILKLECITYNESLKETIQE